MLRNVYRGTYFTRVQTCNVTPVQSATEWTASVHTLHMSKPVMYPVFKVLRTGLQGHLTGGLQGGRYFQRGLKGGGYLKEGLQGTFRELTGVLP